MHHAYLGRTPKHPLVPTQAGRTHPHQGLATRQVDRRLQEEGIPQLYAALVHALLQLRNPLGLKFIIATTLFTSERVPELKQRVNEGRVELVNAFFLESTINLSGGEALVRMGATGCVGTRGCLVFVRGTRVHRYVWCA